MTQFEGIHAVSGASSGGLPLPIPAASAWRARATEALRDLQPLQLVLLCAVYVAVAKGGLAFASSHESVSPVWPPTGVALAAVLLLGYRVWPAILAGAFIANITTEGHLLSVAGISIGNTLEAVVGSFLLLRVAGFRRTLEEMRDVWALLGLAALGATMISATIGVGSLWAAGSIPTDQVGFEWRVWWLGDAAGALLVAPLILVLASRPRLPAEPARIAEGLVSLVVLAAVSVFVFTQPEVLVWLVFPILMWIAFRFGQSGAVLGSLAVTAIGVWLTADGNGPFAHESRDTALLTEQAFMGMAAATALFAAVLGTQHQRLRDALAGLRRSEQKLKHLTEHDSLTGLLNRRRLIQELDGEVARNRRHGGDSATLLIDLDHFKYVNDTLGHAVGDHIIARIASLLRDRTSPGDLLARLGGDEFAVFLSGANERTATAKAEALLEAIREQSLVASPERSMRVTASIGIALLDGPGAVSGEELLAGADIAMYRAKQAGRDRIHVQGRADEMDMRTRLTWSERVRDALEHDRFVLHAQPILDLSNGEITRHELLLRMFDRGELIPPSAFLYVAEEFGMIQSVDRWVIGQAIELIEERAEAGERVTLEVNMSGTSITDDEVLEFIEDQVSSSSIDPSCLIFEVTETAAISSIEKAKQFARRVEALGCAFALDDFGTGFGSFYYLKHLPFDYLKIDGDFVRDLPNSPTDQLTVRAIVEIAQGMGKRTIAEFVESEASLEMLRGYGVDFAQGFHIGAGIPIEDRWPAAPAPIGSPA